MWISICSQYFKSTKPFFALLPDFYFILFFFSVSHVKQIVGDQQSHTPNPVSISVLCNFGRGPYGTFSKNPPPPFYESQQLHLIMDLLAGAVLFREDTRVPILRHMGVSRKGGPNIDSPNSAIRPYHPPKRGPRNSLVEAPTSP